MNAMAQKIGQVLLPERFRPYITFRLMSAFVAVLAIWNIAFVVLAKPQRSPQIAAQIRSSHQLFQSSYFLVLYNIGVAVGCWAIYASRQKAQYYQLRVLCYGMLLGGVAGEVLNFVLWTLIYPSR
jgi:lysylphosphatidylglycerol synthetase-like protein (DUF2156 family)